MEKLTVTKSGGYKRTMPILWWTKRLSHLRFITRELTSLSVLFFAVVFLGLIYSLSRGPEAYAEFLTTLGSPVWIVLHVIALVGLIFHSITWFNLAPKAMVVKMGAKPLPGVVVMLLNYAGWVVVSVALAWLLLR